MKPILLVNESHVVNDSFIARYVETPHTSKRYHYHEEYELLYNIENTGTRCVGDSIERYRNNDLVLVGSKIPHFWHSDEEYFSGDPNFRTKAVIVQFVDDVLINSLLGLPELGDIKNLFERSSRGIQISGLEARVIGDKMIQLTKLDGWRRLLMLVEILSLMNEAENFRLLSTTSFFENHKNGNEEKISKILNLMVENYNRDFTLEEAASNANMSISAFCRYFKKNTTKTFSHLLNEIRIGFACKSLIYTENSISEIAFNSGYNNVPYFNRLFKKLKEVTPNEYRQKHLKVPA
jgi:AraC-like DNA-binding protein